MLQRLYNVHIANRHLIIHSSSESLRIADDIVHERSSSSTRGRCRNARFMYGGKLRAILKEGGYANIRRLENHDGGLKPVLETPAARASRRATRASQQQ